MAVWTALYLAMVTSGEPAFDPYDHVAPPFGTPSWVFFPLF